MDQKRVRKICCEPGCDQFRAALGRCSEHYEKLRLKALSFTHLKRMTKAERELSYAATVRGAGIPDGQVEPSKKWAYEPSDAQVAEVIAQCGGDR